MSKRELEFDTSTGEAGGSRQKRRRETEGTPDVDVTMSDPLDPPKLHSETLSPEEVKELGMKLFVAVRDAEKEGRSMAYVFLRKVPKRQYPDYYELIKQPIAMEDIKKKLDHKDYSSLEAVRSDFELMFNNAKQYNQSDHYIYQDAKELLKLVNKTYQKLLPPGDDEENKHKPPTLHRLMKTRLEKLINKKDATGRVLSTEFIYLPSRKEWPIYYKQIKKPQCLDTIQKNIKKKEYQTAAQFAADVELVFSNCTTFNQDGTQIWIDAVTLRDYFRQLMSDMPPPHSLPEYAKLATSTGTKIKIRPPQALHAAEPSPAHPANGQHSTASITLRVPAAHPPKPPTLPVAPASVPTAAPAPPAPVNVLPSGAPPTAAKPASKAAPKLKPAPPAQPTPIRPQRAVQQQAQAKAAAAATATTPQAPQTVSFINANASHYPRSHYVPPPAPTPTAVPAPSVTPSHALHKPVANIVAASQSPAPIVLPLSHQLKSIEVRIQPKGRFISMDHRDGVKSWFLRLVPGESRVNVSSVSFIGEPDDEESSDEEAEEKDEDYEMDVDMEGGAASPSKNLRSKGKRGRGRPAKAVVKVTPTKVQAKKKAQQKIGEVQLKLNSIVVKEQVEHEGEWDVYLPVGPSIIEVGEVGGMIWKLYLERPGES